MKDLKIGGHSRRRGVPLDLDVGGVRREQDLIDSRKLKEKRARCIGEFDTGLACNCREANITDFATEMDPDFRPNTVVFGPRPSPRELLERFRPHHRYVCCGCGAMYANAVIEGKRGYVPQERLPDPA